jgi:hypothetical protein
MFKNLFIEKYVFIEMSQSLDADDSVAIEKIKKKMNMGKNVPIKLNNFHTNYSFLSLAITRLQRITLN